MRLPALFCISVAISTAAPVRYEISKLLTPAFFKAADTNGDGKLDFDEFMKVDQSYVMRMQKIFAIMDEDRDELLNVDEFSEQHKHAIQDFIEEDDGTIHTVGWAEMSPDERVEAFDDLKSKLDARMAATGRTFEVKKAPASEEVFMDRGAFRTVELYSGDEATEARNEDQLSHSLLDSMKREKEKHDYIIGKTTKDSSEGTTDGDRSVEVEVITLSDLDTAFKAYDEDSDGAFSAEELRAFVQEYIEYALIVSPSVIIKAYDNNNDDKMNREEFDAFLEELPMEYIEPLFYDDEYDNNDENTENDYGFEASDDALKSIGAQKKTQEIQVGLVFSDKR